MLLESGFSLAVKSPSQPQRYEVKEANLARTERYQQIRSMLIARRSVSLRELMAHFEVSRATIFRDIAFLRDRLGMPVELDRELGAYRLLALDNGAELPGIWLSANEIHALLSMQHLLENIDTSGILSDQLQPLRQRLLNMLGSGNHAAETIAQRIRIISSAPRRCYTSCFQAVAEALLTRRRLEIRYRARTSSTTTVREVSPQRLTHYRDNWYLDAWCHTRQALRSFAVDAIEKAKNLAAPAQDIPDNELDHHLASGYGIFAGSEVNWACLRFSAMRARWVAGEQWHPQQKGQLLPDGRYDLRLPYSAEPELIMDILKYGPDCEVLEPKALQQRIIRLLEETLGKYQGVSDGETNGA